MKGPKMKLTSFIAALVVAVTLFPASAEAKCGKRCQRRIRQEVAQLEALQNMMDRCVLIIPELQLVCP